MASHRLQHRPQQLAVPPRSTVSTTNFLPTSYPFTPTPTPSKLRHTLSTNNRKSSLSFLFLILFSLRSLYSALPFLRSSPSFSLFPFSFLVSFLSFLLTLSFSLFQKNQRLPVFALSSLSQSQIRNLLFKSLILAIVFLLRFQALRYCGTAAMILAELSGDVAFRFWKDKDYDRDRHSKVRGFFCLFAGLFLLSVSWDRMECFPLSRSNLEKFGSVLVVVNQSCLRIGPMLLPFLSGFLGCYEKDLVNGGTIRQLGHKRVQLISLFFTTAILFLPALINVLVFETEGESLSFVNLGWSLANTVLFGVLLNEWYNDEKWATPRDSEKEFLITFVCTLVLELAYFPELSLWGLLICGILLWAAIRQLNWAYSNVELGAGSSVTFSTIVMKPIHHILSERKSRKIALFLLINTGYMVVEFVVGFMSNSLGLISDACHMLFDCAALAIGLYASYISRLPANNQFNYGRGRFEVLSGYVNAVFLVLVGALIVLESLERILDPQEIATNSLLAVSVGGLLVNVVGLIFFHEEHHHAHGGSCSHSHPHADTDDHVTGIKHDDSILICGEKCSSGDGDRHGSHHEHHGCDHVSRHDHKHHGYGHNHESKPHDHGHNHESKPHDHGHKHEHHAHGHCHGHHDHAHYSKGHLDHHHEMSHHHHHDDKHDHRLHAHGHNHELHECGHSHDHHNHAHSPEHHNHHHHGSPKNKGSENEKHHHHYIDHNMEGIFLHVLADTLGSVGVVISTLLIKYKGWLVADPACSIFISVLIVTSVIPLLRNSAEVLLQRVPRAIQQDLKVAVNNAMKIKGVSGIQNLHVWSLTTTDVIGTVHLRVSSDSDKVATKTQVSRIFRDAGIKDLTLQQECNDSL